MKNRKHTSPQPSPKERERIQETSNFSFAIRYSLFSFPIFYFLFAIYLVSSCGTPSEQSKQSTEEKEVLEQKFPTPSFNADSAYAHIKTQVEFGPRIPGSEAHEQCAEFIVQKLKSYNAEVIVQKAPVITFDNKKYTLKNIIASFNPQSAKRILFCGHWDTRPFADRDSIDMDKPIDGANDGASSVAVLLETARQINLLKPSVGIDLIFFDLEDYGQPHDSKFAKKKIPGAWEASIGRRIYTSRGIMPSMLFC